MAPSVQAVNDGVPSMVLMGGALSRAFPLNPPGPVTMGKADDCQIQLNMSRVSRHHCRLELSDEGVTVADLASTNGVLVNGRQVKRRLLRDGDRLQLGSALLVYVKAGSMRRFRRTIADQRGRQSTITGTYTQRHLLQIMDREVIRATRYRRPLCLVVVGITNMAQLKERFGPWSGGRVMQQLALVIHECLRRVDSLARLTEEELAIVLPEVPLVGALAVGDKVSRLVRDAGVTVDEQVVRVTPAVGIAAWAMSMAGATDLMEAAAAKLAEARQGAVGGNTETGV